MVAAWSAYSEGPGPGELRRARPVASAATQSFFDAMAADAMPLALTDSVRGSSSGHRPWPQHVEPDGSLLQADKDRGHHHDAEQVIRSGDSTEHQRSWGVWSEGVVEGDADRIPDTNDKRKQ